MPRTSEVFYINLGVRTVLKVLVPASLALLLLFTFLFWPRITPALEVFALSFIGPAAFAVYLLRACTVSVGESGVVLYGVNRLQWPDVIRVLPRSVFELPYLVVSRSRGFDWYIPLYLKNLDRFYTALDSAAPQGNPLQIFAASRLNDRPKA